MAGTRRFNGGFNFFGMVTIIIHQFHVTCFSGKLTVHLKTTPYAAKTFQSSANGCIGNTFIGGNPNGR